MSVHEHLRRLDVHAQNTLLAVGDGLKGAQLGRDSPPLLPLLLGRGYSRQGVQVGGRDLIRAGACAEGRTEVGAAVGRHGVGNDGRGGV